MHNNISRVPGKYSIVTLSIITLFLLIMVSSTKAEEVYDKQDLKKAHSLSMQVVRVLPDKGVISAYEPIIADVKITNISTSDVQLYSAGDLSVRIEVRNSHGILVGDSLVYSYGDVLSFNYHMAPGQSMTSSFIPSAVYQFSEPGNYSIRIMLLDDPMKITSKPSDLGPVVAEVTIPVTVLPFDGKRLKKRCNELITPNKSQEFPSHANMMALWSVRHNAALPALKFAMKKWGEYSYGWPTVIAIRRIKTATSKSLIETLKSQPGKTGQAALSSEKADLRIHSGDYYAYWTK